MKKLNVFNMVFITLFILYFIVGRITYIGNWHSNILIPYYPHIRLFTTFLGFIIIIFIIISITLYVIHRKKGKKETEWNLRKGLLVLCIDILICVPLLLLTFFILPANITELTQYPMHEKVTVDEISYSIKNVEKIENRHDDTQDIILFNIKIENNSDQDYMCHLLNWELEGKKDNKNIMTLISFEETSNRLSNGTIYANETWEGVVAFEIPKEVDSLQLNYHTNPYIPNPPTFSFIIEE